MDGITYMMSALLILTLVYEHGFLISFEEMEVINMLYHFVWIVFLVDISLHLLLNYSDTKQKYRGLAWLLSLMLYLTLIPVIFHEPEVQGGIHDFWSFFHSRLYHVVLLTLLSLLQLSNGIVRLLGRRTNPSLIFASSFLIFILIGAALLMLPRATYHGISFYRCSVYRYQCHLCHGVGLGRCFFYIHARGVVHHYHVDTNRRFGSHDSDQFLCYVFYGEYFALQSAGGP